MPNRNRTAGNNLERKYAIELRDIGYDNIVTSRSESRLLDAAKVDLFDSNRGSPEFKYFIQVKNTTKDLKYTDMFKDESRATDLPYVIMHNKTEKRGTRFFSEGEYVIMEKNTFYNLIRKSDGIDWQWKLLQIKKKELLDDLIIR